MRRRILAAILALALLAGTEDQTLTLAIRQR